VGVTNLPNPNYHPDCIAAQKEEFTFLEALKKVCGSGFPPHACGDLIYSGHTACTFMAMYIFHKTAVFQNKAVCAFMWFWALAAIISIFGCRSHYTVDVVLGLYVVRRAQIGAALLLPSCYPPAAPLLPPYSLFFATRFARGSYFAYFLSNWYFQRAEGVVKDWAGDWVKWLEGQDLGGTVGDKKADDETAALRM
jgi:hypothetical protein